jgi:mannose-6-phosphate isomerase-like protein (cupin superfamily)
MEAAMPEPRRSIQEVAARLTQPWTHLVLGQVDDYCAYLSRFLGSYVYHQHAKDEMYLVLEGEIYLDYASGSSVNVRAGESVVVRAYENHRSRAEKEALVLMFKAKDLFAE